MKFKRSAAICLPVAMTLVAAGCSTGGSSPPPRAPRTIAAPIRSIAVSPGEYVAAASSASLFAIRASDLIVARPDASQLGPLARRLQADHGGIGSQLSFAGRRLDLLPSATLLPRHQAMLDEIAASGDPRAAYLRHLRTVLPQALALHRNFERYGTSATLRPVAAMAAPVIEREVDALRRQ